MTGNNLQQEKPVIADYHISKNMIFARRTLREDQFDKYSQIYDILTQDMPKPNMVIYLHASLDTLLERIRLRNRDVEANIQPSYLEQLSQDYEDFMNHFEASHPEIPVIRLNGDQLDFVKHQDDLTAIVEQVKHHLNKGEVVK